MGFRAGNSLIGEVALAMFSVWYAFVENNLFQSV